MNKSIKKTLALVIIASTVLFLLWAPVIPIQVLLTGKQAELVCSSGGVPCLLNPEFNATGFGSITYVLFGFGTHYPLTVTFYANSRPYRVVFRDEFHACGEWNTSSNPC